MVKAPDDTLIKEAKKYKTADEFVKKLEDSGEILYHGTTSKFDEFDVSKSNSATKQMNL